MCEKNEVEGKERGAVLGATEEGPCLFMFPTPEGLSSRSPSRLPSIVVEIFGHVVWKLPDDEDAKLDRRWDQFYIKRSPCILSRHSCCWTTSSLLYESTGNAKSCCISLGVGVEGYKSS